MLTVRLELPPQTLRLGLVRAEGLGVTQYGPTYEAWLDQKLDQARHGIDESLRQAVRDMLRFGRYKPTGRGKPASEYLTRLVQRDDVTFPRINAAVDAVNAISAASGLPISLWDVDRSASDTFEFCHGRDDKAYVFNGSGQTLALHDLVVGCRVVDGQAVPCVSPIKDSHATKTTDASTRVLAAVYAPWSVSAEQVRVVCEDLAGQLAAGRDPARVAVAGVEPGQSVSF